LASSHHAPANDHLASESEPGSFERILVGTVVDAGPPVHVELRGQWSGTYIRLPLLTGVTVTLADSVVVALFSDSPADGVILGVLP